MMNSEVSITKNGESEGPIPSIWRPKLNEIVEAFANLNIEALNSIDGILTISQSEFQRVLENIEAYGDKLTQLDHEVWDTSVYIWMGKYWELLVDLTTLREVVSDLVLFVNVYEKNASEYEFEVTSIHVP